MLGPEADDLQSSSHFILYTRHERLYWLGPVCIPPPFNKKWNLWVSAEYMDTKNKNNISQPPFAHRCGQWAQFWPADYGRKGYIELLRNILKIGIVRFPSAWWLDFGQSPRSLQSHLEPCGLKYLLQKGRVTRWKEPGFLMLCGTAIVVKNCLHPNYFCFSSCFASCLSHLGC